MVSMLSEALNDILPRVQQPSRYLGGELNAVHKDLAEVQVRIALAFPDLYDLGLPNLGLMILYDILNRIPGVWAERAYHPAPDMEQQLRARELPLFALESRSPLREFDAVGFTLQHELTYTNLLNMLDLADIPLLSSEREDAHPLIIAGGPGAFNPEPLADFVDAFVPGDGEEVVVEIAEALREAKGLPREERLRRLADIEGVFAPSLFPTKVLADGMVATDAPPASIRRRVISSLDTAPFPTRYIVPFTEQVHDRVSLEVLRGCTHGCRFCQAGMITRPVRERSVETLDRLMREAIANTGYEQVALSSLSTCDHSSIRTLVAQTMAQAAPQMVSVSLPSLRLDTFAVELAEMVEAVRRTGLTFAPEAATPRLRAVINKWITDEDLFAVTEAVFARGWDRVKLYFMIGLPTEQVEDVRRIADLVNEVLRRGKRLNPRARVSTGVATFAPKPHTPFQWERQISVAETREKQALLGSLLRDRVKFGRHDAEMSMIEGVLSRGDRRIGQLLLEAHRLGCCMDAWSEHFDFNKWQQAFDAAGVDPEQYLRARDPAGPLPWDHIGPIVERNYLLQERERALAGERTPDCREGKCNNCGVMLKMLDECVANLGRQLLPPHGGVGQASSPVRAGGAPVPCERGPMQRIRFRWARRGELRFLSHRETVNVFIRAFRRARIPVAFSGGFHPQPRLALGAALPVGVASEGEYADVLLTEAISPADFATRLGAQMPEGMRILAAWQAPMKSPSLMSEIVAESYEIVLPAAEAEVRQRVQSILSRQELVAERHSKSGPKRVNIRPLIRKLETVESRARECHVRLLLRDHDGVKGRPQEVVEALLPGAEGWFVARVRKLDSFVERQGELVSVAEEEAGR
jgi:radical SAM family uncharacterized protein/radical SAM-linked protein